MPASPLIRQLPFHDVSRPGLHQLPVYPNRVPSANVANAWAAASPAYQLQLGLNDSAVIHTGSLADQIAGEVEMVYRHVAQQRIGHLVAEPAEPRPAEEAALDEAEPAEPGDLAA